MKGLVDAIISKKRAKGAVKLNHKIRMRCILSCFTGETNKESDGKDR